MTPAPKAAAPKADKEKPVDEAVRFRSPESSDWRKLSAPAEAPADDAAKLGNAAKMAREELKNVLLASLQMQHVMVLAGSGTSLGPIVGGPSMGDLWNFCINKNPTEPEAAKREVSDAAKAVAGIVNYSLADQNIESFLSQCEAYLQIRNDEQVTSFLTTSKKMILTKCTAFVKPEDKEQLQAHRTFLHRLSRRRARDSRVKIFTTNYDLCFETAAARQGLIAIDGFSFGQPREYDPRFFLYDIVRRSKTGDDLGNFVEGIFQLFKLHGSVNWARDAAGRVEEKNSPSPDAACMIYPAKGKYQQSYLQPHLELMSQYLAALREPNTCLIIAGFGFNDDHLSEPILSAVHNNPHLRLLVVNRSAEENVAKASNRFWKLLAEEADKGSDVWFINTDFQKFSALIPDLKSLTPAQKLAQDVKKIAERQ